mmetsp:Transcript_58999/g.93881  ORF Transcript_58999/g.93881 Transcript_58999/m.93881 type:complete len:203 (-) Transcript_58999:756-1364(-)
MRSCSHHTRSWLQHRQYLGLALACGRRQRHNRLSTRRQRSTSHEVHLSTHSTIHLGADRVGANLASDIHLDARVDGVRQRVGAYHLGVVDIRAIAEQHQGIIGDEVIQPLGAHCKRRGELASMVVLVRVGDDTHVDQVEDAVAEHLSVDAEVLVVVQTLQDGVGNAANAHLQARFIGNQLVCDILANALGHRIDHQRRFVLW